MATIPLVALLPGVGGGVACNEHLQGVIAREKGNLKRRGESKDEEKEVWTGQKDQAWHALTQLSKYSSTGEVVCLEKYSFLFHYEFLFLKLLL